jgi:deazaflavin-dependent oxidoreductase (nitroreductase family)
MDEQVRRALETDHLIDITTRGRKSGQPRRIEIRLNNIGGQLYLTGRPPRPRSWYANLVAHPEFTLHLKQSVSADLAARATAIREPARRREIIAAIHRQIGRDSDLELWVERSPLMHIELLGN